MPHITSPHELKDLRSKLSIRSEKATHTLAICNGTGCQASRSAPVVEALREQLSEQGLEEKIRIRVTGCQGFCEQGPVVVVEPGDTFYCRVAPEDAAELVSSLSGGEVVERLLYVDPVSQERMPTESDIPFFRAQERVLLGQNRRVDPCSIDDYIAAGGYRALAKVLNGMEPERVIEEIKVSGLRGRGGAGFPTGRKWASCRAASGDLKYVVCNADEGDPGAYMDRCVLEGNPHLVIEGMLIGARAIGAAGGYIYVRKEYPLAVENARIAVAQARNYGLLGRNILDSGFSFDIEIARGGGAFVCGESTALMASIEGQVGDPSPKDVHTVEKGLWNRPTNLNNVETWANVPFIINNGADWFSSRGTEHSKGTKIFALTGRIKNTGLVEVPMGTSLRSIIFDIGGGAANGMAVKAVQTGGPSGGCLPASLFDLPVDFETLSEAGSMVGSGGMVVMDERTCMVDVAKYFLEFLQEESCGSCAPCRIGLSRMLEIVEDIAEGRGRPEQIDLLEELADTVAHTSLCGLGKTAPNPVLSTLRYFRKEFLTHIHGQKCPAGVCRALTVYAIDPENCNGCGLCLRACPAGAISGAKKEPHVIDPETCTRCGICRSDCQFDGIYVS